MFERGQKGVSDHFYWYISPHMWTSLAADAGSSVASSGDSTNTDVVLTTGATDNNECAVRTTNEHFLFAADKPLIFEARIQYAEANTDDANVAVGFANAVGANLMVDDGAGPKTSFSGGMIYKVDGGTVWRAASSLGTTQTLTASTTTAGGASYQVLRMEFLPINGTDLEVTFFVDGVQLKDSNNLPIKHTVIYASATEMHAFVYVKAGGANSEVVNVDYIEALQLI